MPSPKTKKAVTPSETNPVVDETVQLGAVTGRVRRVPIADVHALLKDAFMDRVVILRSRGADVELQERVRATEGRCAPIVVVETDPPTLFDGIATAVAAIDAGMESVFVVSILPGNEGEVQTHLSRGDRNKPEDPEDDLIWRVHAHHQ